MAQKATKTLALRNAAAIRRLLLITALVHLFYLLLRALLFRASFTRRSFAIYIALSLPSLLLSFWLVSIGRPSFDANGGVKRAGEDLEQKGLTEWMWDVVYWSWGCIVLAAVLGDWSWWAWIAIPGYSLWLAWSTFSGMKGGLGGMMGQGAEGNRDANGSASGGSKRQKKLERRGGQKVAYG